MTGLLWVAWRGQRAQAAAIAALLLLYGAAVVAERLEPGLSGLTFQLSGFLAGAICLIWGAPLVAREFEAGTCKLAWTQGVSRGRWLVAVLGVAAGGAVAAAAVLAAVLAWGLPDAGGDSLAWAYYESHGVVPFGRALFALALGVALGAVTRHTRIAMPLSVLLVGVAQLAARALRARFDMPFWTLQWTETAAHLLLAVALTAAAYVAIRR
ncbi:ABC transporter permease subunit [Nonomuraea maritima]|uniref:ABC transporter permease subunit n=1 Tax=Nonomuraea maritima TaxID=683260 RepID=UPI00370F99D0